MDHAHIHVYDSLLGALPGDAKKQIASLLMTKEEKITIEYANNQISIYNILLLNIEVSSKININFGW